ncbi:UPF0287-domain-containing protein [Microthyrium microscopicum]|uniref:COX assembly mitochondrial protein n=1 Tax=Microthyrium microscopicum TaxID=703497 RepID=A0A6A6UQN2_9PEZI|nr:UPF0287-domain-containing protein [Microthyrium microscopicum]
MHPLLHTKDNVGCEEVMYALEACHARGFLYSALNGCADAKRDLNKCLRAARLARTRENYEKTKEKNIKVKSAWADIDANS